MASLATWAVAAAIVYHAIYTRKAPDMTALTEAVDALIAEVTDSNTKLDSITAFIEGVPALVTAAVTDALAAANVAEAEAAALIATATAAVSDKVDAALAAVEANT